MCLLKDAGGHNHHIFSFFFFYYDASCQTLLSCFCLLVDLVNNTTVKLVVVSNFDTRLRKLLKDLNVADL
uniref:Uncharacterized protein n=1 Tax=Nelumbo nucifera TaxID=4432 RepID=A0A822YRU6_NELNU|nr:TPA_asm: hypothetical protein HUJ06_005493 [Nelumbo nucifera]